MEFPGLGLVTEDEDDWLSEPIASRVCAGTPVATSIGGLEAEQAPWALRSRPPRPRVGARTRCRSSGSSSPGHGQGPSGCLHQCECASRHRRREDREASSLETSRGFRSSRCRASWRCHFGVLLPKVGLLRERLRLGWFRQVPSHGRDRCVVARSAACDPQIRPSPCRGTSGVRRGGRSPPRRGICAPDPAWIRRYAVADRMARELPEFCFRGPISRRGAA